MCRTSTRGCRRPGTEPGGGSPASQIPGPPAFRPAAQGPARLGLVSPAGPPGGVIDSGSATRKKALFPSAFGPLPPQPACHVTVCWAHLTCTRRWRAGSWLRLRAAEPCGDWAARSFSESLPGDLNDSGNEVLTNSSASLVCSARLNAFRAHKSFAPRR